MITRVLLTCTLLSGSGRPGVWHGAGALARGSLSPVWSPGFQSPPSHRAYFGGMGGLRYRPGSDSSPLFGRNSK